ncbi:MAG: permease-like cell division protein FtsX [Granulosicoccaceae bacterium]|jgi:cell division transport system permease protein
MISPKVYVLRHLQVCMETLGRLSGTPVSTLMTVAVVGIALALPVGLHVLLQNAQHVTNNWDTAAQISLFIKSDVSTDRINSLAERIEQRREVARVEVISREAAMNEFREHSGFGEALEALEENPFPPVIVVYPLADYDRVEIIESLLADFNGYEEIELAQLDMQWIRRLYAIMDIGRQGVLVLAALLALAVLLIVGNTIRLAIENRREEIEVMKLVGGTNTFVRRPFLYTGFFYGLFGGLLSWLLGSLALWLLSEPVNRLATLYQSDYRLATLDGLTTLVLLGSSVLLGLAGAWLAVSRHLHAIEPA